MSEDKTRDIFVTGLKNAHAMENQALSIMKPQVKRIENYPDIAGKLEQHITETEGQIVRLQEILTSLAEDHSSLKDLALSLTGSMAALGQMNLDQEIAMADWLEANLRPTTIEFANLKEAGQTAKV